MMKAKNDSLPGQEVEIMNLLSRWRRLIPVVVYGIFYLAAFNWLENRSGPYHIINSSIDSQIPFCEFFIIPYFLWFFYIGAAVLYFAFFNSSKSEYSRLLLNLGIGMTAFLVVSYIYPNGLTLRPVEFPRDNIFTDMVRFLYRIDTPTNVLPSIHVYNAVAIFCAINSCRQLHQRRGIRTGSFILTTLIVLSTMFLKQHSICDVMAGITFSLATYILLYRAFAKMSVSVTTTSKIRVRLYSFFNRPQKGAVAKVDK